MEIKLINESEEDLAYWQKSHNVAILKRIAELFDAIEQNPTQGIGKPERLKHNLSGYWSRRINRENRLVYRIDGDIVWIISMRGHYK